MECLEERKGREKKTDEEEDLVKKVRRLEWILEKEDRHKRKRNIVIKEIKREGELKKEVTDIWKDLGVKVEVEEIKKLKKGDREREGRC